MSEPLSTTDEIRAAYESQLGAFALEALFEQGDGLSVGVLKWTPRQDPDGVYLYLTVGASRIALGEEGHRLEYYIGLDDERDDIAGALAELAAEPVRAGELVDVGRGDDL